MVRRLMLAAVLLAARPARADGDCDLVQVQDGAGPQARARADEDIEQHFQGPITLPRKDGRPCTLEPLHVSYRVFVAAAAGAAVLIGRVSSHEGEELVVIDSHRCAVRKRLATPWIVENQCAMKVAPRPGALVWSGEWTEDPPATDDLDRARRCGAGRWILDLGPGCKKPRWRKSYAPRR